MLFPRVSAALLVDILLRKPGIRGPTPARTIVRSMENNENALGRQRRRSTRYIRLSGNDRAIIFPCSSSNNLVATPPMHAQASNCRKKSIRCRCVVFRARSTSLTQPSGRRFIVMFNALLLQSIGFDMHLSSGTMANPSRWSEPMGFIPSIQTPPLDHMLSTIQHATGASGQLPQL